MSMMSWSQFGCLMETGHETGWGEVEAVAVVPQAHHLPLNEEQPTVS